MHLTTLLFYHRSLHREVPLTNSCAVISHLFSAKYFFVFAFVAFVALIGTGLLILTCDQLYNVAANLVSLFMFVKSIVAGHLWGVCFYLHD